MSAAPLLRRSDGVENLAAADRFPRRLQEIEIRHLSLWHESSDTTPVLGEPVPRRAQRRAARAVHLLIAEIASEIERFPDGHAARLAWRRSLEQRVDAVGAKFLAWPASYRELLVSDTFFDATVEFARAARDFDPALALVDLGQALRNLWIANSLQILLDLEVVSTPSLFAYSMLYPYTDNYLDDPCVLIQDKVRMSALLGGRLRGKPLLPEEPRQDRIFQLVERIESHWCRESFPEVFLSLQEIHRAQISSLRQQEEPTLDRDQLLRLSFAKGGASVLADGHLAAGSLGRSEADFCYGYGTFLQLLDDLQDVARDRTAGHATLFSVAADRTPLDRPAARLYHYMRKVVENAPRFRAQRYQPIKDLILQNCTCLLIGAIAENPKLFTRSFRNSLERRWPISLPAFRRLRQKGSRRIESAGLNLCASRGVNSLYSLL